MGYFHLKISHVSAHKIQRLWLSNSFRNQNIFYFLHQRVLSIQNYLWPLAPWKLHISATGWAINLKYVREQKSFFSYCVCRGRFNGRNPKRGVFGGGAIDGETKELNVLPFVTWSLTLRQGLSLLLLAALVAHDMIKCKYLCVGVQSWVHYYIISATESTYCMETYCF